MRHRAGCGGTSPQHPDQNHMTFLCQIALVLLLTAPLTPGPTFTLRVNDLTANRTVICAGISSGDALSLSFTHSMFGGEVREDYVVTGDGQLRRVSMTTENAAAADYYAYTVAVIPEAGRYRIDVAPTVLPEIVIRVDHIGHHVLIVESHRLDLLTLTGDRHQVRVTIERQSFWDRVRHKDC
jgi:hypothetical protein